MSGLLSRVPWPSDLNPLSAIAVKSAGAGLALVNADSLIQTRDYGAPPDQFRPSVAGDVLSWNGGGWEGRPSSGTPGAWETAGMSGILAVYCPDSNPVNARAFVYWPNVPNV